MVSLNWSLNWTALTLAVTDSNDLVAFRGVANHFQGIAEPIPACARQWLDRNVLSCVSGLKKKKIFAIFISNNFKDPGPILFFIAAPPLWQNVTRTLRHLRYWGGLQKNASNAD